MSFLNKLTASLPFGKKEENKEYFFAVNIGVEQLAAALWIIDGKELKILETAAQSYSSNEEIVSTLDKLLDQVIGLKEIEPQKILFGVPNSWILDDNLKDEYLKLLRNLVKELELTPMAYVATSNALAHFLEKQEGVPTTAILVGFEDKHLTVTVVRAGKPDGVKVIIRGENSGSDIEKALLTFTDVETLPSKILIYGSSSGELKSQLASFSWMSKLSFLHFPKIEVLTDNIEIKSVCLAGGSEINESISYSDQPVKKQVERLNILEEDAGISDKSEDQISGTLPSSDISDSEDPFESAKQDNFGFMVGDVAKQNQNDFSSEETESEVAGGTGLVPPQEHALDIDDFEQETSLPAKPAKAAKKLNFKRFIPGSFTTLILLLGVIISIVLIAGAYLFLLKADIKIFVEPKIVEKDAQVVADPNQKAVDEEKKIIPGQVVNVEVSGSAKDSATGKRQIGDPAKGTIIVYNKTSDSQSLSKGSQMSGPGGVKFTLDVSVNIASQSASDSGITFGKTNATVTAVAIGADGNLPSGSDFIVAGFSSDKLAAKSEGNFSGGTSKDVTVVSSEDQQRLLAKLSSDLRKQGQQKLQEKYPNKKILEEALSESTTKKSYSKNINDQAGEFSLNMTVNYKGTAFDDADLKTIVSKLVTTQVPDGFRIDLSDTETQADVSKLEKDGKLIFLAKFRAKLLPKIDTDKILNQIKFKDPSQAMDIIKGMDNILGSEIKITPSLPGPLQRLPILSKNIKIEVGLK
ncbi:hypothetical protein HYU95_05960 [Candidatus Daviesbacteria bacterium]|nr:hypothetical protein [Candidatus Daviesbacteria bacterium]